MSEKRKEKLRRRELWRPFYCDRASDIGFESWEAGGVRLVSPRLSPDCAPPELPSFRLRQERLGHLLSRKFPAREISHYASGAVRLKPKVIMVHNLGTQIRARAQPLFMSSLPTLLPQASSLTSSILSMLPIAQLLILYTLWSLSNAGIVPPAELCLPSAHLKELSGCIAMTDKEDECAAKETEDEKLDYYCTQEMLSSIFAYVYTPHSPTPQPGLRTIVNSQLADPSQLPRRCPPLPRISHVRLPVRLPRPPLALNLRLAPPKHNIPHHAPRDLSHRHLRHERLQPPLPKLRQRRLRNQQVLADVDAHIPRLVRVVRVPAARLFAVLRVPVQREYLL